MTYKNDKKVEYIYRIKFNTYLIFVILGVALIRGRCLIEGGGGGYLETQNLGAALIRGRRLLEEIR